MNPSTAPFSVFTTASASPSSGSHDSQHEAMIDRDLINRFLDGEEHTFVELMDRYRSRIFTLAQRALRNTADAEEITQDTFMRVYRALPKFRGDSSFSTWIYRIAQNLARNRYWYHFRRRRHQSLPLDQALSDDSSSTWADLLPANNEDPCQESTRLEFERITQTCLGQLESWQSEILTLRIGQSMPYGQIAERLQISEGTVKSRINRARNHLRKLINEAAPDFDATSENPDFFEKHRPAYGSLQAG